MLQNRPEFVHPFGNGDSKCLKTDRNVRKKHKIKNIFEKYFFFDPNGVKLSMTDPPPGTLIPVIGSLLEPKIEEKLMRKYQ